MNKLIKYIPATLFFLFICRMIILADLNRDDLIMEIGHSIRFGDKIGHFLIFGIMALLLNHALQMKSFKILNFNILWGSAIVLIFAIMEEFTQLAFENRTFEYPDMLCDVLGIVVFTYYRDHRKMMLALLRKFGLLNLSRFRRYD